MENGQLDEQTGGELRLSSPLPRSDLASASRRAASSTPHAIPGLSHGWLSRLRSYFILDPLIWLYTLVMGLLAIPGGMFDRSGGRLHWFSYAWSWLIMKTIVSPVKVTGLDKIDTVKAACLCGESRVGARHSRSLHQSSVSVPHCVQEGVAVVSDGGLAAQRSGQVCIDQQNPAHSISSIRCGVEGIEGGAAAGDLSRGRTHAGWRDQAVSGRRVFSRDQGAGGYRSGSAGRNLRTAAR